MACFADDVGLAGAIENLGDAAVTASSSKVRAPRGASAAVGRLWRP
jgi:hypothetical protein